MTKDKILRYRCGTFLAHQKGTIKMGESKTCWNCKHRELDMSISPCSDCELHFKWEPREDD
ncbi:hypothetical protein LCGC14_1472800 [marine sediment metagenome]|uniref:Uncharacterized protein n=1 Tax=marine sediment metagenome TaxID=412755 RepID=A0A0F9MDP2_9ZZZZ